jgi:hypothetical protein
VHPSPAKNAGCCEARRKMAEAFATATRLYDETVVVLTSSSSRPISNDTYETMCQKVLEAHQRAEEAMVMFEEHVASHQCFEEPPAA